MATVNPFHTNLEEYGPGHRDVYHDTDTCPDGKRIKPEHREAGTANRKHCIECQREEHRKHHHRDRPPQPNRTHA